jgi:hypothetical protein
VLYAASENKEVKKMKIGKNSHMKQKIVCEQEKLNNKLEKKFYF